MECLSAVLNPFHCLSPPADHAFHFSQLHIILDRTSTLLEVFANGLQEGAYLHSPSE